MKKLICIFIASLTVLNLAACTFNVQNAPGEKEDIQNTHAEISVDQADIETSDVTVNSNIEIEDNKDADNLEPIDYSFYEGRWERTFVHSSLNGQFTISNADEEGFDFVGEFFYYSHSGDSAGRAVFTSENEAVFEDKSELGEGYIYFTFEEDMLTVTTEGFISGMGMNVSVPGYYTKGEPEYTNANVIENTFSEEDLELIKSLLGEDYEDIFVNDSECGSVVSDETVLTDGRKARFIGCIVPTMYGWMGYRMIITEDEMIYFLHERDIFKTNDPDCDDKSYMFELLGEEDLG